MSIAKPTISKGTRDFSPREMIRRNYIFKTIRAIFEKYAYLPIETPSVENLSTLLGKYGEEGDRLIFKILNSGDFTKNVNMQAPPQQLSRQICEKGLRYDLTVPFARFVVMHQNDITFPFKRYQMQPVWRADRPQKGRYREFYQCDVDVIGSNSLFNEAELLKITDEVFSALGIQVTIKINNRKILSGLAEMAGAPDKMIDICTAIDKLDKIGKENVIAELVERGISGMAVEKIFQILEISGDNGDKLQQLQLAFKDCPTGIAGIEEVKKVLSYTPCLDIRSTIELDITLARGLSYYTGAIFEVKANDVAIGSISGGGRYDDLTGVFGLNNLSGVGISYGAERIYDVMEALNLFPQDISSPVKVLFLNFGENEMKYALPALQKMRAANIACELYPEKAKIAKQMTYANAKAIPFVVITGEEEMAENLFSLKNMLSGKQEKVAIDNLIAIIQSS